MGAAPYSWKLLFEDECLVCYTMLEVYRLPDGGLKAIGCMCSLPEEERV